MEDIVYATDVLNLVRSLRTFLTQLKIDEAMKRLVARQASADVLGHAKLRESQPWLFALERFDRLTFRGQRRPATWPPDSLNLAMGGKIAQLVTKNMSQALRKHHREMLLNLDGNHAPFFAEWSAAYFYAKQHGAQIVWSDVHTIGADFVARIGDLEFDVECKRYGAMISERLGDTEADKLASHLLQTMKAMGRHGILDVDVIDHQRIDDHSWEAGLREQLAVINEQGEVKVDSDILKINGKIARSAGSDFTLGFAEANAVSYDVRGYGQAGSNNGRPVDMILIRMKGPRRTGIELTEYLFEKMEFAVREQLSGKRAGVLVLEFARVDDPRAFRDSPGVYSILYKLFATYPYLAAVVFRAAQRFTDADHAARIDQYAYFTKSEVTTFPEVANLKHIGGH